MILLTDSDSNICAIAAHCAGEQCVCRRVFTLPAIGALANSNNGIAELTERFDNRASSAQAQCLIKRLIDMPTFE